MIAFVDTSVVLRLLFGEASPLAEWATIRSAYGSALMSVEIARVIDRYRVDGTIDDDDVVQLHREARRVTGSIDLFSVTDGVLERAGRPMPTTVGTLDAIHLATALELAERNEELVVATHDRQLGRAALASGLAVCGL